MIEVVFAESPDEQWADDVVRRLERLRVLQVDGEGRHSVRLRVDCAYDPASKDFTQDWSFLDLDGGRLARVPANALSRLQAEIRYFYLTALRDAGRHFDARGPFWRPFLKDSQLSPDRKAEIEDKLREVNELVVSSHESFDPRRAGEVCRRIPGHQQGSISSSPATGPRP